MWVPLLTDTSFDLFGMDPVFSHTRGSSLASSAVTGNPTVATLGQVQRAAKALIGLGLPEDILTRNEARDMQRLFGNYFGVTTVLNAMVNDLPKVDPYAPRPMQQQ